MENMKRILPQSKKIQRRTIELTLPVAKTFDVLSLQENITHRTAN